MKKLISAILFILTLIAQLQAQDIESWINSKKIIPFEKLYVHVDRELYAPGDTIWMKVYQVNGFTHELNPNFRNIFVQLVSEDGRIVKDLMLLSIDGLANAEFTTDSLANGTYTIRAFTKYLQNFGEEAFFHKKIAINKSTKSPDLPAKVQPDNSKMDISFLPEGGNLLFNAANTVAFKAIDQKGRGIYVTGKITDDLGDTITSFSTSYLGMGKFVLVPEEGAEYFATIDQQPELKIALPPASKKGFCLNYSEENESLMFKISVGSRMDKYPEFYFVVSHKGVVQFYKKIEMVDYTQEIKVGKNMVPNGISKITLLDSTLVPVAERLIYVDKDKSDLLNLKLNQKGYKPREEVKLDIDALLATGDSIKSTLSVAVVNKNYLGSGEYSQNIKSYLLLDSDLKGTIESPASYFVNDEFHTSAEKLDLLMLVHGWRSYLWNDVEQTPAPLVDDWTDAGINVSGYVKKLLWNEPLPDAKVYLNYVFNNFPIRNTITDQNGRFLFKHAYLQDTLKVMINARTKKGTPNAEIILDPFPRTDSIVPVLQQKSFGFNVDLNPNFIQNNQFRQMKELEFNPEKGTILLQSVDIVQKKTSAMIRSFGEYPWADKTLTVTKNDYSFNSISDFLMYKVAGMANFEGSITRGGKDFKYLLDGIIVLERGEERDIQMKDIETIDIVNPGFKNGFAMGELGQVDPTGFIAINRKKSSWLILDEDKYIKGRVLPTLKGFHRPEKFYSPKYTFKNLQSSKPDLRPTLYWNPDVSLVNGKTSLGFFTSDNPGEYAVYLEGITQKGKICFGTTSFKVVK